MPGLQQLFEQFIPAHIHNNLHVMPDGIYPYTDGTQGPTDLSYQFKEALLTQIGMAPGDDLIYDATDRDYRDDPAGTWHFSVQHMQVLTRHAPNPAAGFPAPEKSHTAVPYHRIRSYD